MLHASFLEYFRHGQTVVFVEEEVCVIREKCDFE